MAPYGRVVTLMGTPGDDADLTAYNLNLTIHNVMMLTPMWKRLEQRLREQARSCARHWGWWPPAKLIIRHAESFPLAEAGRAQAFLESGKAVGKVTLRIT